MSNLPRFNDARRYRNSIIEEWKNPSKFDEDVLRSDQLYEERAIDVVPDASQKNYSKEKNEPDKVHDNIKNGIKSRPRNSSGTVRSIPIKNYQASIAHNIGTLRRSEAPQLQFESSMSEPEKSLCITKCEIVRSPQNDVVPQFRRSGPSSQRSKILNPSRRSCHSCDYAREIQNEHRKINSKLRTLDRRIAKSEHNIAIHQGHQDISDFDDYLHKSASQKFRSSRGKLKVLKTRQQSKEKVAENVGMKRFTNEEPRVNKKWGTIDLEHGSVGQKISAYEENAKRSNRNLDSIDKYQVFTEIKKHRAIGVPLVGMHNACGLPVVASWHDHELLEPLRVKGRVVGTLRPIFKGTRAPLDLRHRTHLKRKPLPPQSITRSRHSNAKQLDKKIEHPSVKSLASLEAGDCEIKKKIRRHRPSFKAKKAGTFSSKSSLKWKSTSIGRRNKENNNVDNLHGKSLESGTIKRQTLYARDDGDDAVQVLKSLCLNPLARNKSETDIIW